jgi:NitT/TauT family transport system permease protein
LPETLTSPPPATLASSAENPPGPKQAPGRGRLPGLGRVGRITTKVFISCIGLVILAVLWQVLPSNHIVDPTFVTPFDKVCSTWWHMLQDGTLWSNTRTSLARAAVGFFAAIVLGVPLGLLIGANRLIADLLNPVLELFRNTAPLALLPVFILILGIGQTQIFTGIRLAGGYALLVLIAAEFVGANSGLGFLITNSEQNFQTPMMYAAIISISMIGVLLNLVLLAVERRFSTWRVA